MLTFKTNDFKKAYHGYTAVIFSETRLDIEGMGYAHENCTLKSGMVEVKIGRKVTKVSCVEGMAEGRYRYSFHV